MPGALAIDSQSYASTRRRRHDPGSIIAWTTIDRGIDNESFVRTIKGLLESAYPLVLPYVVSSRSFVSHLIISVLEHACWLSRGHPSSPTYGISVTVMSRLMKHCVDTMCSLVRG
jgi:hypothetical protein